MDDDPDGFPLEEDAYLYLMQRFQSVFGHPLGRVRRRWMGQYLRLADRSNTYVSKRLGDDLVVVTGVGGMGLTAGPSIAVEVLDSVGL